MQSSSSATAGARARAAVFRARRVAVNAIIDLKYRSVLAFDRQSDNGLFSVRNSDYAALQQIFRDLVAPDDVLVDVGCATGRVINFWLEQGHTNRMVGLEFNTALAERTRRRLERYGNVEIVTGDATQWLPEDGTVFYLFNPFGADMTREFKDLLVKMPANGKRRLIAYYNCKHVGVFEEDDRFEVETVALEAPYYAPLSPLAIINLA